MWCILHWGGIGWVFLMFVKASWGVWRGNRKPDASRGFVSLQRHFRENGRFIRTIGVAALVAYLGGSLRFTWVWYTFALFQLLVLIPVAFLEAISPVADRWFESRRDVQPTEAEQAAIDEQEADMAVWRAQARRVFSVMYGSLALLWLFAALTTDFCR